MNKEEYTILTLHALKKKVACLTLDVEQDYGTVLEEPSYDGIEHIPDLVEFFKRRNIPLTCFVQGSLFETHPAQIEQLAILDVEFGLHSFSHPAAKDADVKFEIESGKQAYLNFFGKEPVGYRFPDGVISREGYQILAANGFKFDSSIFPSLRPNAFNNLGLPTKPYFLNHCQIVELPFTVFSNVIRIPIALSYIKLLGKPYFYFLKTLPLPDLIIFDFHLHDLFRLNSVNRIPLEKFPSYYRRIFKRIYYGGKVNGIHILDEFIATLRKKKYTFSKLIDVYEAASR
ncbi:polysaccharide deacetylase family protein [Dehalococcoidia bacterium]|nr:polysaccharide deacetylase family protein [Dehalococcoidia bacterium]